MRELEIAIVVTGHSHHGAGAVLHQHVISDPHRNRLARGRIDGDSTGEDACLLLADFARHYVLRLGALEIRVHRRALRRCDDLRHQRMLRRQHQPGGTEDCIGTGGEYGDVVRVRDAERHMGAFAAPDPVALRLLGNLAPVQRRDVIQQAPGELRGAKEPLFEQPLLHNRVTALAVSVDHLLVGEHGLVDRAPVDSRRLLVSESLLVELEEQPLGPLVIVGLAGDNLLAPVNHQAGALKLPPEVFDVSRSQRGGVDTDLDGVILSLDAEAVEADRFEDGFALLPLEPPVDIRAGEREQVADVQPLGRGVGEHHQLVVRFGTGPELRGVRPLFGPSMLPGGFDGGGFVSGEVGLDGRCVRHQRVVERGAREGRQLSSVRLIEVCVHS